MKHTLFLLILLNALNLHGQEFKITGMSDKFYSKIYIENEQDDYLMVNGTVSVYSVKDDKELLKVESESITLSEEKLTQVSENIFEIPYKDQSNILYEDFNFDGLNDIAIQTFFSSKGPAYSIYLSNGETFNFSPDFTDIIEASQGNYGLNPKEKTIYTMSSGGCCWHSYSTYIVENGNPVLLKEVIEEIDFAFEITTTKELIDGKYVETVEKTINLEEDGIIQIMSFELVNKNKRVVLYNINDRTLNYALVKEDNKVEFSFPIETEYRNPDFIVNDSGNELTFKNGDAVYKIYQKSDSNKITSVGILVTFKGKNYDMKGDLTTLKGNLKSSSIINLDNVYNEY